METSLKVPLLLAMTLGTHITMTPPNPPPSKAEQLPPGGLERFAPRIFPIFFKVGRLGHLLVHSLFWAFGLAEISILVTQQISDMSPHSPLAATILQKLDPAGGSKNLKLTPSFILGCTLTFLGAGIRLHCYRRLHTLFTFELSVHKNHKLITDGVYGIVRHPSYTGATLVGIGAGLCTLVPGAWAVECVDVLRSRERLLAIWVIGLSFAFFGLGSRMRKEDRMLRESFGKEWDAWAARVRYKILPGVC